MTPMALRFISIILLTAAVSAQGPTPRFRFERPVEPGAAGANRLTIDVPLLIGGRPFPDRMFRTATQAGAPTTRTLRGGVEATVGGGLSDLRLFDANGREVPYLFIGPRQIEPVWVNSEVLPIAPVEKKSSGFEADLQAPVRVDRLRVEGIPAPFLKRVVLEGSGDRERWTLLVAEGTLFDLPNERLRRVELDFRAGDYRYLRVTWDDTNSGRVPPPTSVRARRIPDAVAPTPSLTTPIGFERRPSEPNRSRFRLQLPGAQLPIIRIELDVEGVYLMRQAEVSEAQFDGRQLHPSVIGSAMLKRVTRDGLQANELAIPISTPREAQLELVVDDGDNPPLAIRSVTAVFAELPTIYFESDGGALVARYGDSRLEAPRYDLEAARNTVRLEAAAVARWGQPTALTMTEPPLTVPMPTTGATLDPSTFKYARNLSSSTAGLMAVPLDAAVLAHSSGAQRGFADVRVLDESGRQIPYLVERLDEPLTLVLPVQRRAEPPPGAPKGERQSWYRLELPYDGLPPARVTVQTPARVFKRRIVLTRPNTLSTPRQQPSQRVVASEQWVHASVDRPAAPIVLNVPPDEGRELFLAVEEGDNTPLPLGTVSLLLPSYRIRFFRPAEASLRLVYGRSDLGSPEYDLELLAPQVLGAAATELRAEGEEAAPVATEDQQIPVHPGVFWAALTLAVLVLLGIIVRLMRRDAAQGA